MALEVQVQHSWIVRLNQGFCHSLRAYLCIVMNELYTNTLANSFQVEGRDACPKQKPTFLVRKGMIPKHYTELDTKGLIFSRWWLKK